MVRKHSSEMLNLCSTIQMTPSSSSLQESLTSTTTVPTDVNSRRLVTARHRAPSSLPLTSGSLPRSRFPRQVSQSHPHLHRVLCTTPTYSHNPTVVYTHPHDLPLPWPGTPHALGSIHRHSRALSGAHPTTRFTGHLHAGRPHRARTRTLWANSAPRCFRPFYPLFTPPLSSTPCVHPNHVPPVVPTQPPSPVPPVARPFWLAHYPHPAPLTIGHPPRYHLPTYHAIRCRPAYTPSSIVQ